MGSSERSLTLPYRSSSVFVRRRPTTRARSRPGRGSAETRRTLHLVGLAGLRRSARHANEIKASHLQQDAPTRADARAPRCAGPHESSLDSRARIALPKSGPVSTRLHPSAYAGLVPAVGLAEPPFQVRFLAR